VKGYYNPERMSARSKSVKGKSRSKRKSVSRHGKRETLRVSAGDIFGISSALA
jgi:hypothetical protein